LDSRARLRHAAGREEIVMSKAWVLVGVAWLGVTSVAMAAEQTLRIDPTASAVSFTLRSTLHQVEGRMVVSRGEIRFDTGTGEASGEVVLDARQITTGNEERDEKMHRKVIESGRFPEIVFAAEQVTGDLPTSGEGRIELRGTVTVHGAGHPVTLTARVTREGDHLHAVAAVPIPYVEWGMKDPSVLVLRVAKEVNVALDIDGRLSP